MQTCSRACAGADTEECSVERQRRDDGRRRARVGRRRRRRRRRRDWRQRGVQLAERAAPPVDARAALVEQRRDDRPRLVHGLPVSTGRDLRRLGRARQVRQCDLAREHRAECRAEVQLPERAAHFLLRDGRHRGLEPAEHRVHAVRAPLRPPLLRVQSELVQLDDGRLRRRLHDGRGLLLRLRGSNDRRAAVCAVRALGRRERHGAVLLRLWHATGWAAAGNERMGRPRRVRQRQVGGGGRGDHARGRRRAGCVRPTRVPRGTLATARRSR